MLKVYNALANVQTALARIGIAKDGQNVSQRYMFRGIDAVYNTLAPILSDCGVLILPRVLSRTVERWANKNDTVMFSVGLEVEYDFVCVEDCSKHTIKVWGEAMDSSDKATNKAMSAAYKYAIIQAFCIPVDGEPDADTSTPEVKPKAHKTIEKAVEILDVPPTKKEWEALKEEASNVGFPPEVVRLFITELESQSLSKRAILTACRSKFIGM